MPVHAKIVTAIRSGDISSALLEANRLLAANPFDSDLLGLKGLALAVCGRIDEAIDSTRLAVTKATLPAQRIKHAGNFAQLLVNAGRRSELAALADMDIPDFDTIADAEFDAASIANLCAPLLMIDKFDFVVEFLSPLLERPSVTWDLEHIWLKACAAALQHARIVSHFNAPNYRWRDRPEATAFACAAAEALQQTENSDRLYAAYLAMAPIHAAARNASQIISIMVISSDPPMDKLREPASAQHFRGNFPSQLSFRRPDRYRFFSVFAGSPARSASSEIDSIERAITLNNCVNGEMLKRGELAKVQAHEEALGLPIVNAAVQAIRCTRVETAEMLTGIRNLVIPKTIRFRIEAGLLPALHKRIRELFAFPVILRTVGAQEGRNMHLASNGTELDDALASLLALGERDFYVIDFAGVEHEGGFFRRIRAAYVENTPTLMRVDYDAQWMVKGRKNARIREHYRNQPALLARADSLIRQPERLGEAAWDALREIGRRIPLDVYGIDFDVDHDGRIVFFEANATMNLLSNAPSDLDYPHEGQDDFLNRLDKYFLQRAGITIQ